MSNNIKHITAPNKVLASATNKVFLAGSIDDGAASPWREGMVQHFRDTRFERYHPEMTFVDPLRKKWEGNCDASIDNPMLYEQMAWELDKMDDSDGIFMFFEGGSKSPITLLELGLCAGRYPDKLIVVCEESFWRRGNVQFICQEFNISIFTNLKAGYKELVRRIDN